MKILVVHNLYREAGGEDTVVANEVVLLREHGHDVKLLQADNQTIRGVWGGIRTGLTATYSRASRSTLSSNLRAFAPQVVHAHNIFPLFTPSIYDACIEKGVPVVQTLHNYRFFCAGAMLIRDGKPCEKCLGASPYYGVRYGCYRGSRLQSLPVARMIAAHRRRGTWQTKVSRFIALTSFAQKKFIAAGIPEQKIAVKPNFTWPAPLAPSDTKKPVIASGALFVGRLSVEKGVRTLFAAWQDLHVPLRVIGDGPQLDELRLIKPISATLLGRTSNAQAIDEMTRASMLIVPSESYENFPMVLVEAFAHGLPVIASRLGAVAEIVKDGVTGLLFSPGDAVDLAAKVRWADQHPEEMNRMGSNAKQYFQCRFSPSVNYEQLIKIYSDAGARL